MAAEWFATTLLSPTSPNGEVGDSKEEAKIGPSHPILQQSVAALKE